MVVFVETELDHLNAHAQWDGLDIDANKKLRHVPLNDHARTTPPALTCSRTTSVFAQAEPMESNAKLLPNVASAILACTAENAVTLGRVLTARVQKTLLELVVNTSLMLAKQEFVKTVLSVLITELATLVSVPKGKFCGCLIFKRQ